MAERQTPEEDSTSIGNILVELGFLTQDRLRLLVAEFRASKDELLGEFIVRKTKLTEDDIKIAMTRQDCIRSKSKEAVIINLMEIAESTHQRVLNGADQLTMISQNYARAMGGNE